MLADLLAPLDYPRRSAYNLARSGGNVFTGDASWQDLLRALPAAGGLAATPFLGPLGGAGIAAGLQGLGGLVAPETFTAPTAADLVGDLGGDPESLLQTLGAQLATDPLTYAGGLGAVRAGHAARQQALHARAAPSFRPGGPPGMPGAMPMHLGSGVPPSPRLLPPELAGYPEFGAPRVPWAHGLGEAPLPAEPMGLPEVLAAQEADAVAAAAREAMPPPFQGVGDQPWVSPRGPEAPLAPGELHPELQGLYGILDDMRRDIAVDPLAPGLAAGRAMRPDELETRVALLREIGALEATASPRTSGAVASIIRPPAHAARLLAANDEVAALSDLIFGLGDLGTDRSLLRGVEPGGLLTANIEQARTDLRGVMGRLAGGLPPDVGPTGNLTEAVTQFRGGAVPPTYRASELLNELEAAGFPIDRPAAVGEYRDRMSRHLNSLMARHARQSLGLEPANMGYAEAIARSLGGDARGAPDVAARLRPMVEGPQPVITTPSMQIHSIDINRAYDPVTAQLRQSWIEQALREAGLL